jgi:transcriptional regulator with XRE-family HTH domain
MSIASRTKTLRLALGENQDDFALRLGVSQATIYRLENGQAETGAQRILLDQIEASLPQPVSPGAVPPAPPAAPSAPALCPAGAAFSSEVQP